MGRLRQDDLNGVLYLDHAMTWRRDREVRDMDQVPNSVFAAQRWREVTQARLGWFAKLASAAPAGQHSKTIGDATTRPFDRYLSD